MSNNLYEFLDDPEVAQGENPDGGNPPEIDNSDDNSEGEMSQAQESSTSKSKESWSKRTTNAVKSAVKNWKSKSSLIAALGPILLWIFVAIVILIVIIGLVMFLVTMPGMVMEQLKALFNTLGNYVACFFGADVTKQIDDTEIFDTLDYLEQMGYDLKGFGFLTDYVDSLDVDDDQDYDDSNGAKLDTKTGVIRNDDDKIIYAKSDYIYMYIMSDNYVYTLKNKNLATQGKAPWKGTWFAWLGEFFQGVGTAAYRIGNFLAGPIYDITGVTNAMGETYGKGLIVLWDEKDDIIGKRGTFFNTDSMWNWDKISIDVKSKKLSIARNAFLNANNALEFSLDGWSGRYGMPIEFLLSVHLATMMPDLASDMISSFPTEINVYLHKTSGEATTAFKTDSGYVTYENLENALTGVSGRNFLSATKAWFDNAIINDDEANAAFELGIPHSPECSCVLGEDGKYEVCDACKKYVKTILKYLRKDNDYTFLAYDPYIANVTDHWYRDVYFVMEDTNLQFVDYDYEYEAMMKERWTLYETDEYGEYVLYELNSDGSIGNKFNGTAEQAKEQNKAVVKKAITINGSDSETMEDLGWDNPDGIWVAYEEDTGTSGTNYEAMYPDISSDEEDYEIKSNIYVKMEMLGSVIQTGEGQRTETNNKIKKMFLQNNYFRYDGSIETAEIITELRKRVASKHGAADGAYYSALTQNDLDTSVSLTRNGESKEYKVSDYAGKVSLNQDSLNAFSMLENTHTLDADYIYRDFKELIVELGYFSKEELTDETPRLLQWLIPDIGSGGFPKRELDKREDEYGTNLHSKADYEANNKNLLRAMYEKSREEKENGDVNENIEAGDNPAQENVNGIAANANGLANPVGTINDFSMRNKLSATENISKVVSGMGSDFERVAEAGDGYDFKVRCGSVEYTHYYQFKGSYAEKTFTWSGATKTLHQAACGPTSCVNLLTGYGQDVNPTNNIVGINFDATIYGVKAFMEQYGVTGESFAYLSDSEYVSRIEQAFSEGKPIITLMHQGKTGDSFWTSGGHFVAMVGQDSNGNIITLDSGTSSADRHTYSGGIEGLLSTIDALWVADEAPDGMAGGSNFEGYKGNEAVVSPVTGVLLEYGTYDTEIDSITGEEYRVNTDLKHNVNAKNTISVNEDGTYKVEQVEDGEEKAKIVHDKVGYAKILVLDAENYQKLESTTKSSFQGDSLVKIKQINKSVDANTRDVSYDTDKAKAGFAEKLTSEEDLEDWNNIDKTIYGYKEFAESYEKYGIAGYVVYIDGFVCELPDEELSGEGGEEGDDGDDISEKLPNGEKLTLDSFKKVTDGDLQGKDPLEEDQVLDSKYEKDSEYKMASKKATDKINAESKVKDEANSSIYSSSAAGQTSDGTDVTGIFIKEGTVIGRTMTDKELIEKVRKEKESYEYYRPEDEGAGDGDSDEEENHDKVMGNYIRIMMRDLDKTVVENVEDYMKLDDPGSGSIAADDVIKFMAGVLTAECGPTSAQGQAAAAWVIKNRLDSGKFGATLEEILVAPNQFVVVATDPSQCTGGYVTKGETISLEVNGTTYYVNAPSDLAIQVATSVMSGGSEYKNEIADRCYWKSAGTNVDSSKNPIQIPPGTGNKYHY